MNRRGFALVTTLWLIVVLGTLTAAALAEARSAAAAHRNRVALRRAAWAREACLEMLLAAGPARLDDLAPVDLGRGAWCSATIESPSARLNLNLAQPAAIRIVAGSDSLAAAMLARRPFVALDQLSKVPGVDSATFARLAPQLTVRGDGRIDLNAAPAGVLAAIPGFGPAAVVHVLRLRAAGDPVRSLDALASRLARDDRRRLLAAYGEAAAAVTVGPSQWIAHVEAGVTGEPVRDRTMVTLVVVGERLGVVRREPA